MIIKLAVKKLAALTEKSKNDQDQADRKKSLPLPIQELFLSLIESVKPFLKNNETRKKEPAQDLQSG